MKKILLALLATAMIASTSVNAMGFKTKLFFGVVAAALVGTAYATLSHDGCSINDDQEDMLYKAKNLLKTAYNTWWDAPSKSDTEKTLWNIAIAIRKAYHDLGELFCESGFGYQDMMISKACCADLKNKYAASCCRAIERMRS